LFLTVWHRCAYQQHCPRAFYFITSSRDIRNVGLLFLRTVVLGGIAAALIFNGRLVHQKSHQQEAQPRRNPLPTVPQLSRKYQTVPTLHVNGRIQTFKVGSSAIVIQTTSIRQGDQKGPFRLVRVHVKLLPLLARHVVLYHVRFAIVQCQLLPRLAVVVFENGRHDRVHGRLHRHGQRGVLAASQRLLGVRVGRVLAFASVLRDANDLVRLGNGQARVGNENAVLFRYSDPVRDCEP